MDNSESITAGDGPPPLVAGAEHPRKAAQAPTPDGSSENGEHVVIPWEEAKRFFAGVIPLVTESKRRSLKKDALAWPDSVDMAGDGFEARYFNPEHKSLRPEDVEYLESLVGEFDERLEAMADVSFELLAESLQEYFELELFQKSDLPEPGFAKRPLDSSQFSRSMNVQWRGWTCKVDFRSLDFPAFDAHLRAVEALRAERTEAVRAYIRELP